MVCQRCRGLLVRETFDGLSPEADMMLLSTRCINCGSIEDPVVRANRRRPPAAKRAAPRDRKSTRLNSSHSDLSRMPSSA